MTTDRIQPARAAAPTDRPAQHGDGSGFAAMLEGHAAPDTTAPETAAPAQPELGPALDESRPSLIGLPVIPTSPPQPAHDAVATGCAAIVVPAAAVEPPASAATPAVAAPAATPAIAPAVAPAPPVAAQPAAPAAVPAPVPFEATIPAPSQAPAAAPTAPVLEGDAPAPASPVVPTPAPAGSPSVVAAPVEREAPVVAPVAAAPSPQPATTAAPQSARPADPAPTASASAEPQPAAPAAVAPQPAVPASGTAAPERTVPLHRAPAAVATLLHVAAERGITHARMALRPAELGGIEIRLQATAAGISAQVVADSPEAARLLAQAGDDLRRALEAREVTLLSLEVSTSSEERNRESARGEFSDRHGDPSRPGARHAEGDAETAVAATTATVIELPGGLLVDVLA